MEQTKALNALEPFLALSKSATSPRAAADLVERATSAPNTFVFTELLQTPQIQSLASSDEFAPHLTLLRIFSHGIYSSYTANTGLPALNDAQRLKLRQLSLLTLAKHDSSTDNSAGSPALGYAALQEALGLPSRQALEELVISAIYAGLIKAQLNPKASLVQINSVSPLRDVAPTAIGGLLSSLQAWAGRCESTLESLSSQMTQLQADADRRAARAAIRRDETHRLMEKEQKSGQASTLSLKPRAAAAAATVAAKTAAPRNQNTRIDIPHPNTTTHNPHPITGSTHADGRGGGGNTTNNITNNEMNPVLTVGDGSSFLQPSAGSSAGAAHLQVKPAVTRGSGQRDGDTTNGDAVGGGDVEMEDEDGGPDDGQKRTGKRKLEP